MKSEHSDTSLFLLRGLKLVPVSVSVDNSQLVNIYGYINSYVKDIDHVTVLDRPIYLLFKPKDLSVFGEFVEEQYIEGNLKEDYDYPNGYTVLLYEFPEKFLDDYNKIIIGKYSQVSEEYKKLFPIKNGQGMKLIARAILDRDKDLRATRAEEFGMRLDEWGEDWELWKMFEIEKETLNINKILITEDGLTSA